MLETVELSAGTIEYADTGDGPAVVFLHGAMKDATVWDQVVAQLPPSYRCIRPTMPLGSHRIPLRAEADLSVAGLARLTGEFLAALDLDQVVLVQNHWGAAQVMLAEGFAERISKLVLCACEAFDNYPPGAPGRAFVRMAKVPGALGAMGAALRTPALARRYAEQDPTSLRPAPPELAARWLHPFATDAGVRRDLGKVLRDKYSRSEKQRWAAAVGSFAGPVLVVWATADTLMPRAHGARLAAAFPNARLVEITDSGTCVPLDQPAQLAAAITDFLGSV